MPKRKITLAEAFDVLEQHGLTVEVKHVDIAPAATLADFIEPQPQPVVRGGTYGLPAGNVVTANKKARMVKVVLHAQHTIGSGGDNVGTKEHPQVVNNGVLTYGPGIVEVPEHLSHHLLHQDQLARQADDRTFDRNVRSYVVMLDGTRNVGRYVSRDNNFDLSGLLGSMGDNAVRHIG
jgi:hypothetical protein